MSVQGNQELCRLIKHFKQFNKPSYLLSSYSKLLPKIASMFVGLDRKEAATKSRKMLEVVKAREPEDEIQCPFSVEEYDQRLLKYIGGWLIYNSINSKIRKKADAYAT